MSGLMFTRTGSSWRSRKVAGGGEVRDYGRIAHTPAALRRLARKLAQEGVELRFCYEAGPCGYGIQRQLSARGHECVVVAPSLIPKRAGDRVKTDRRDAASLAKLHRAGELTAVWVPDPDMRRCAIWYGPASTRCGRCAARVSSFRGFCCARAAITGGRHGPSCIAPTGQARGLKADGWRGSSSSRRCIISCSRTTLQQSKPPRRGAIG
jgi:hypothetical protein